MIETADKPLRIRSWRWDFQMVEIEHTRDLRPTASDQERVQAAVHAYSRTLAGVGAEGLVTELRAACRLAFINEVGRSLARAVERNGWAWPDAAPATVSTLAEKLRAAIAKAGSLPATAEEAGA